MTETQATRFLINWIDLRREPECPPNPDFPNGVDLDLSRGGAPTCFTYLDYPAPRCGLYVVTCLSCGRQIAVTTAGRPDDPRSLRIPCRTGTAQ